MNIKKYILTLSKQALLSSNKSGTYSSKQKNNTLRSISRNLKSDTKKILDANKIDLDNAKQKGIKDSMVDRLILNKERIDSMRDGLKKIISIPDTLYRTSKPTKQKNGIYISQMRVPLGVIGMIYESRPNVTVDASALSIKSGNAIILRGGSESINTNVVLAKCVKNSLTKNNVDQDIVQLIDNTDRNIVNELLLQNNYIDIVIPRGGKNLIKLIDDISSISVLRHLDGICHVYLDKNCDFDKALNISINSKTQRTGVCNAMETLIVHNDISKKILPLIEKELIEKNVEIRGCKKTKSILPSITIATDDDWRTEYLDSILSIITVDSLEEAIRHISEYGSGHTDVIVTEDTEAANIFLRNVDSSSVMHNASSRFADGYEYGLGAEIGISTNKLHARGPVGIEGLTNEKFIVIGDGNIR